MPGPGDDKYSRGVVGVVAGSRAYPGAAVLACSGAVRAGAGYVRHLGGRPARLLVLGARPEVVASRLPGLLPGRTGRLPRADAWVVGPGLVGGRRGAAARAVRSALGTGLPCVVDAGALDAACPLLAAGRVADPRRVLLTPHAGELARMLRALGQGDDPGAGQLARARLLARATGATVLLKGSTTVVAGAEGPAWSVSEAPPWLATAGAGDVLAGVAGTLLAQGLAPLDAGALAAFAHGRAARLASDGPLAAMDVAESLPRAVAGIVSGA